MDALFGIIGCGRISKIHAEQINKYGKLIAVCDIDISKAEDLAAIYAAKYYSSAEEMLLNEKEINVVSICTPNGLHAAHSILSLKAYKHVLCEKPMSISIQDANNMIETSKRVNRNLLIVKSSRYSPLIIGLKKLIDKNQLGAIFSFSMNCNWNRPNLYYKDNWKGSLAFDGGILYTQFSHYIDTLIWLLGEQEEMTGFRTNTFHKNSIEFEDSGVIAIKMKSGSIGTIHYSINAHTKNHEIGLTIIAEAGTIQLGGEYLNKIIYQMPILLPTEKIETTNPANDYGFYKGSAGNHEDVYDNLCKTLRGEEASITDGDEAIKTVRLIEDFYNNVPLM